MISRGENIDQSHLIFSSFALFICVRGVSLFSCLSTRAFWFGLVDVNGVSTKSGRLKVQSMCLSQWCQLVLQTLSVSANQPSNYFSLHVRTARAD